MAKAGRGQTRRDSKRRVLRPGESVRAESISKERRRRCRGTEEEKEYYPRIPCTECK